MGILEWQSDGPLATLGLVFYGLVVLALLLPRIKKAPALTRLLPAAAAWHGCVWVFYTFWMLPYYSAQTGLDCHGYHDRALAVAQLIRAGNWGAIDWGLNTEAMPIITGFLYAPLGGELYGMVFFSAVLGFCGCLYFCLAFSFWAAPAQSRNYARIIMFLPSFALWTGIFGKDSWIALGLGLATYGYSAKLKGLRTGLWHLIFGLAIITIVRPHVSVTFAFAMVMAYLWGLTSNRRASLLGKIQMVVLLVTMLAGLAWVAQNFLKLDDVSVGSLTEYGESRGVDNNVGGSAVNVGAKSGVVGTLVAFPRGIIRVLFQPFPWEVHNFSLGLAAVENLFLVWFVFGHAARLRKLLRGIVHQPFLLFSFILGMGLLLMFSLLPNLGLLSRQRAQLMPYIFAPLVAAEAIRRRTEFRQTLPVPRPAYAPGPGRSPFRPALPRTSGD